MRFTLAFTLLSLLPAQTTSPPVPQLSPQAAYDEAIRPVEITHRSIENWSNTETAALAVAVKQAQTACAARPPEQLAGEDLIALARLCVLGQQWPAVLSAAEIYLRPALPSAPPPQQITLALAYRIEASLQLKDPATALSAAQTLLRTQPYTALSQQITEELLRYLQLIQTADSIALATERQPLILTQLRSPAPAASAPNNQAAVTPHELYTAALMLPTLHQLSNRPAAAASSFEQLEAALPSALSPDETISIARARKQYALLGKPLPSIPASVSLFGINETPRINTRYGSATVLLLFPDWCAQCVRMGQQFMPTLVRHAGEDLHLYGLLAQLKPPPATPASPPTPSPTPSPTSRRARSPSNSAPKTTDATDPAQPKSAADLLRGTPTLVVANNLPETVFAAADFPMLIVTDHAGIIRFLQVAPENAFVPGGLVDQLASHVAKLWPPPGIPATP